MNWMKAGKPPALPGSQSEALLGNPDRGLRLEVYLDVGTGHSIFQHADVDALEALRAEAEIYAEEQPTLAQVYFYLTEYWDRPLDAAAFARMEAYFHLLRDLGLKALLRFAYIQAVDEFHYQPILSQREPTPAQAVSHIHQLSAFLHAWKTQIHVLQAGMIGAWGEWDFNARDRMNAAAQKVEGVFGEQAILRAWLDGTPDDMHLQVRYRNVKTANLNPDNLRDWNRVGYHDDFLVGSPHWWNTAGSLPGSADWRAVELETLHAPMDGEMSWGRSNETELSGALIDGWKMAERLHAHHFASLSLAHNYREDGWEHPYSMAQWKREPITPEQLMEKHLPFHPAWFHNESGQCIERSLYEYIRDHLGYYLVLRDYSAHTELNQWIVAMQIDNYGFSTPFGLRCAVALLDAQGNALSQTGLSADVLLPGGSQSVSVNMANHPFAHTLAVRLIAPGGQVARFANAASLSGEWMPLCVLKDH